MKTQALKGAVGGCGNSGSSMVSTIMGLGLVSFMALSMSSMAEMTSKTARNTKQFMQFYNMVTETRMLLSNTRFCTANMQGLSIGSTDKKLYSKSKKSSVQDGLNLYKINLAGQKTGEIQLSSDQDFGGIKVTDISLENSGQLELGRYLAHLIITSEKKGNSIGGKEAIESIPLQLSVDEATRRINGCISDSFAEDSPQMNDKICVLSSNGTMVYDVKTDSCVSTTAQICYNGSRSQAMCPQGVVNKCTAVDWVDGKLYQVDRPFEDESVKTEVNDPFIAFKVSSTECRCVYAKDGADTTNAKCRACCVVDMQY